MLQLAIPPSPALERPRREVPYVVPPLSALVREVVAASQGPLETMDGHMIAALRLAVGAPDLLTAAQCRAQPEGYTRHVLYGDPDGQFTILALVWGPGQFSQPHAHQTWCSYAVLSGALTETLYAFDEAAGTARPLRQAVRPAGYACFAHAGLDQIHRLGNAGAEPAISIHVYGVDRERIATHVNRMVEVAPAEG
jgi:predicted metal-dependent enzyme (double-stranded beta helix superfamily)